jgi:GT2 family glycosyltransferase/glycosyltransferase involved in cell wall biosynthesis
MNNTESLESTIIFDQYSRYRACAELITSLAPPDKCNIIDVGSGGECLLGKFIPHHNITYLDPLLRLNPEKHENMITDDFFRYDFKGKRFDYAVSIDTYEHIPPEKRQEFLLKLSSVVTRGFILAFPSADAGDAIETDRMLNDAYREFTGRDYVWLDEHIKYGLPRLQATLEQLQSLGFVVAVRQNGHSPWYRTLLRYINRALELPSQKNNIIKLSALFNRELYQYDAMSPSYRQIVIAVRSGGSLLPPEIVVTKKMKEDADTYWNRIQQHIPSTIEAQISDVLILQRQISESTQWAQQTIQKIEILNTQLTEVQNWAHRAVADVQARDASIRILEEKLLETTRWSEKLFAESEKKDGIISDLNTTVEDASSIIKKLSEELSQKDRVIGKLESTVFDRNQSIATLQAEYINLKKQNEELAINLSEKEKTLVALSKIIAEQSAHMSAVLKQSDEWERILDGVQKRAAEQQETIASLLQQARIFQTDLTTAHAEQEALRHHLEHFQEQTSNLSGILRFLVIRVEASISSVIPKSIKDTFGPLYRRTFYNRLKKGLGQTPVLTALHPFIAEAGKPFSVQPNGDSALTVKGRHFDHTMCIFLNGEMVQTDFVDETTLSAIVPRFYYNNVCDIAVEVRAPGVAVSNSQTLRIVDHISEDQRVPVASPDAFLQKRYEELYGDKASKYDIICFPITYWGFRFQRTGQILRRFAKQGHRVFYVHTEFTPARVNRHEEISSPMLEYKFLEKNIWQVTLIAPRALNIYKDHLKERDTLFLTASLNRLVEDKQITTAISLVSFPFWSQAAIAFSKQTNIPLFYDCMDDHSGFGNVAKEVLEEEEALLKVADTTLFTSQYLWDKYHHRTSVPLMVRNAADVDHFKNLLINDYLQDIPRPIIGYYGAIAEWFDTDLVYDVARRKPEWNFVFIGHTFGADISKLSELPNVHFLGEKPYDELPKYLYHFDVCTIPFKLTELIKATNPVKFYEYISSGKPVIATKIPELLPYSGLIHLIASPDEFIRAVSQTLREDETIKVKRRELAAQHSWEQRVDVMQEGIERILTPLRTAQAAQWKSFKVTVLVLTHKGREYVDGCFKSLRKQTHPNLELLLVDNASIDDGPAYVHEHFPEVKVLPTGKNLGFSSGNNWGVQYATGDLIFFLNDDTELAPDTLEEMCKIMVIHKQIGGVGGTVLSLSEKEKIVFTLPKIDPKTAWVPWINQESPIMRVDYLSGNSMLFRRSVLDEVGLLDPRFFAYFEETDLCARIFRAGYDLIYTPHAKIWHKEMGFWSLDKNYYYMNRNRFRFAMKNFDREYIPPFLVSYSRHLWNEFKTNLKERRGKRMYLLLKGIGWNIVNSPEILFTRYRANLRIKHPRSFNKELPLRKINAPGNGSYS